jgi:hypothetical protein
MRKMLGIIKHLTIFKLLEAIYNKILVAEPNMHDN